MCSLKPSAKYKQGILDFDKSFFNINFNLTPPPHVSTSKSSLVAGSKLHPENCTVLNTAPVPAPAPAPAPAPIHFIVHTSHQAFILHLANLLLHTAKIQSLPELDLRVIWRNVP